MTEKVCPTCNRPMGVYSDEPPVNTDNMDIYDAIEILGVGLGSSPRNRQWGRKAGDGKCWFSASGAQEDSWDCQKTALQAKVVSLQAELDAVKAKAPHLHLVEREAERLRHERDVAIERAKASEREARELRAWKERVEDRWAK